jgi:uncharacterized membrane protein YbhN (UPF0104 family)
MSARWLPTRLVLPCRDTSPRLRILAGFAVSAICLVLAFRDVPLDELRVAFSSANYLWLVPAAGAQLIALFARARRWQLLLLDGAGFSPLFWAQAVGFLVNNVLPLRAGEAARVLVVNQRTGLPLAQVGASVVLERALDVATILVLLLGLLPVVRVPPIALGAGLALATTLAVALVLMVGLLIFRRPGEALVTAFAQRLPTRVGRPLVGRWTELATGFEVLRHWRLALRAVGWSLVAWACSIAMYWAVIEAVVSGASIIEPAFAITALSLGASVPSSPGLIGVFQLIGQQALVAPFPERYVPSSALSIALLAHAVFYLLTSTLGLVGIARLGTRLATAQGQTRPRDAAPLRTI